MRNILENTGVVLSVAMIFAVVYPSFISFTENLLFPVLILALTLSLANINIDRGLFRHFKLGFLAFSISMIMGLVTVIFAKLFVSDPSYVTGFIVMAFMPPAIAVVPFTYLLGGNQRLSIVGLVVSYILCLAVTPFLIWHFTGGVIDIRDIVRVIAKLIIVPLVLSQILRRVRIGFGGWGRIVINLCFFIVTYTIISLNRDAIFLQRFLLVPVGFVLFARTFGTGIATGKLLDKRVDADTLKSLMLFSSLKNAGLTSVTTYYLFGVAESLPAAISSVFEIGFLIFLQYKFRSD